MLTPKQVRAARVFVGWSREELAKRAGVSSMTIRGFEILGADSKQSTLHKIQRALELAGVEFIDEDDVKGPGVRLMDSSRKQGAKGKR